MSSSGEKRDSHTRSIRDRFNFGIPRIAHSAVFNNIQRAIERLNVRHGPELLGLVLSIQFHLVGHGFTEFSRCSCSKIFHLLFHLSTRRSAIRTKLGFRKLDDVLTDELDLIPAEEPHVLVERLNLDIGQTGPLRNLVLHRLRHCLRRLRW